MHMTTKIAWTKVLRGVETCDTGCFVNLLLHQCQRRPGTTTRWRNAHIAERHFIKADFILQLKSCIIIRYESIQRERTLWIGTRRIGNPLWFGHIIDEILHDLYDENEQELHEFVITPKLNLLNYTEIHRKVWILSIFYSALTSLQQDMGNFMLSGTRLYFFLIHVADCFMTDPAK